MNEIIDDILHNNNKYLNKALVLILIVFGINLVTSVIQFFYFMTIKELTDFQWGAVHSLPIVSSGIGIVTQTILFYTIYQIKTSLKQKEHAKNAYQGAIVYITLVVLMKFFHLAFLQL